MPLLTDWKITLSPDDILRAQGADPQLVRQRRPVMLEVAEWAVQEGLPLLQPQVLYQEFTVQRVLHDRIYVQDDNAVENEHLYVAGPLMTDHLLGARHVVAMLCTIGGQLEETAALVINEDMLRGLALDAAGSAAAEVLATMASHHFETQAATQGLKSSLPLNPGMIGWSVDEGQSQLFRLLEHERARQSGFPVTLSSTYMMQPRKTISLILGTGHELTRSGRICDYCNLSETCRYQDHYQ
jgi:hypothetical protein